MNNQQLAIYAKDGRTIVASVSVNDTKLAEAVKEALKRPSAKITYGPFTIYVNGLDFHKVELR